MIITIQPSPLLQREAIARLAHQLWEEAGRQRGRDQEYWFRAEQQLRKLSTPEADCLQKHQRLPNGTSGTASQTAMQGLPSHRTESPRWRRRSTTNSKA